MSNGGILGENWCVLLQVGHVQLTGAPQSVDYEPGKLASHSQPVRTGSALRDSHRFHRPEDAKAGCCDNHESCGLPSCQQLQSGQLETKPEGYLSVFCVERFGRDQKTQGNKSDGGWSALKRPWRTVRHTVFVYVWAAVACVTAPRPSRNTNILHTDGWFQTIKYQHQYPTD